jgi:hypothetical protein
MENGIYEVNREGLTNETLWIRIRIASFGFEFEVIIASSEYYPQYLALGGVMGLFAPLLAP